MNRRTTAAWCAATAAVWLMWRTIDGRLEDFASRVDELVTATHEARTIRVNHELRHVKADTAPALRAVPDPSDGRVRLLVLGPGTDAVAQIFADGGRKVIGKAIDQWHAVRAIAEHVHGINVDQLEQKAMTRPGRRGRVKAVHQLPEGEIRSLVRDTMRLLTASPTQGGAR